MRTIITMLLLLVGALAFESQPAHAETACHPIASYYTATGETTVDTCGAVTVAGTHTFYGDLVQLGVTPVAPIVEIVASDGGYGLVGSDGGIFAFGDFPFLGSVPGLGVYTETVVTAAQTPTGYTVVAASGAVYTFERQCDTSFRRGEWMTVGVSPGYVDTSHNPVLSVPIPDLVFDMACLGWGERGRVEVDKAIQTAMCESKGSMDADNGSDFTMWQINRSAHRDNIVSVGGVDALKADPVLATGFAVDIYNYAVYAWGDGWQPWSCSRKMAGVFGQRVEI